MHPRQIEFLDLTCEEGLYGGAAGGGKTEALLEWLKQGIHIPAYSGLFLRRTYAQLSKSNDSPILRSMRLYPQLGGVYNSGHHRWTFPSGAIIEFGHMQHEGSIADYQGPSYHRVAWDEVTQFYESQYTFMFSRLRNPPNFPIVLGMRCSANPGGIGHLWTKKRFVTEQAQAMLRKLTFQDPSPPGAVFYSTPTRAFVPSRVVDNPSIDVHAYIARMDRNLPTKLKEQLINGDWDAIEGALIDPAQWGRYAQQGNLLARLNTEGKRSWVRDDRAMRRFCTIDTAGTSKDIADLKRGKPPSSSCCAVWDYDHTMQSIFARHIWSERVGWDGLVENCANLITKWNVKNIKIENAHIGPALYATLVKRFPGASISLVGPVLAGMTEGHRGAKLDRAIASGFFDMLKSGSILLPEPGRVPGSDEWLANYERITSIWTGAPDEPADEIDVTSYACDEVKTNLSGWGGTVDNGHKKAV